MSGQLGVLGRVFNVHSCSDAFLFVWYLIGNAWSHSIFLVMLLAAGILPIFSLAQLVTGFVATWSFTGIGMTVCLHRFLTHQAFETSYPVTFLLGLVGTLTNQRGVLWWSSMHRRHHKNCDKPRDPHSWSQFGWQYAWCYWTYWEYRTDWEFVPRVFLKNKSLLFLNAAQPAIVLGFVYCLACATSFEWAVWGYWVPTLISTIGSLRFNLQSHPATPGPNGLSAKRSAGEALCRAEDGVTELASYVFGESEHWDHHKHPRKACRPGPDVSYYYFLRPLAALGIIWNTNMKG